MTVRPESPADIADIRRLHAACFPTDAEARLVDLLRAAGRLTVSLVAEIDGRVAGHIAFSTVTVSGAAGQGLAPLAVDANHRRRGVGETLVRAGIDECRRRNAGFAVVLGEPHYYGRFGFRPATSWGLSDEYGGGEAFQAMELAPGAIPATGGVVRYAEEFGIFA